MSDGIQEETSLKISYRGEIHRIRINLQNFKLEDLQTLFVSTFKLSPGTFCIQYKDLDGDSVNVTSDTEYEEARHNYVSHADTLNTYRFTAIPRHQVVLQENVTDPLLKAVEKLVDNLNFAIDKVKNEEWAQRAQCGMKNTTSAVRSAAEGARESIYIARQSLPFEQVLKETADGLKVVAESIGHYAQEAVRRKEKSDESVEEISESVESETETSDNAKETTVDNKNVEVAHNSASDDAIGQTLTETTNENAGKEENGELKEHALWSEEMKTIRGIIPSIDDAKVIELLNLHKGNVELVLNDLMEEM